MNNSDKLNISVFLIKKADEDRKVVDPTTAAILGAIPLHSMGSSLLPGLYAGMQTNSLGVGAADTLANLVGASLGTASLLPFGGPGGGAAASYTMAKIHNRETERQRLANSTLHKLLRKIGINVNVGATKGLDE